MIFLLKKRGRFGKAFKKVLYDTLKHSIKRKLLDFKNQSLFLDTK